ncbi:MAG: O-antigen ligase family protein, partial [Flavobacteriales bacterium]|nr:O-antigen ligase family protein [Flavobacteriales bacterium]
MDKSARNGSFIIVFLLFVQSMVWSGLLLDNTLISRSLALSVSCAAVGLWMLFGSKPYDAFLRTLISPISLFFSVWLIAALISGGQAINQQEYRAECVRVFLLFFSFLVFGTVVQRGFREEIILMGAVFLTLLLLVVGTGQMLVNNVAFSSAGMASVTGLMSNRNLFSEYLAILFPMVVYGAFSLANKWRMAAKLAALGATLMIILLLTRSAWVAMSIGCVVALGLTYGLHPKTAFKQRYFSWKRVALISIFVAVLILTTDFLADHIIWNRLSSIFLIDQGSAGWRIQIWGATLEMAAHNVLTGIGAGNWKIQFQSLGIIYSLDTFMAEPLNDFLGVFVETGVFGLIGYLGIILTGLVQLFRSVKNRGSNDVGFQITMLVSLVIFAVISFFNFPKDRVEHSLVLVFILAVSNQNAVQLFAVRSQSVARLALVILIGVAGWTGYFNLQRYQAEKHVLLALNARSRQNWKEVIRQVAQVNQKYYSLDPSTTPVAW